MLRYRETNASVHDDEELLPRTGPISLGAFTKFKPANIRNKLVKLGKSSPSPTTSALSASHSAQTARAPASCHEPEPSHCNAEVQHSGQSPAPESVEVTKSSHLARLERLLDDETVARLGSAADEGVLLSAGEWDPDLPGGAPEPATDEAEVVHSGRDHPPVLSAGTGATASDRVQTQQEERLLKLGVQQRQDDLAHLKQVQAKILSTVSPQRLEDKYGGGQVKRQEINYDLDHHYRTRGTLNLDFRFPPQRRLRGGEVAVARGPMMPPALPPHPTLAMQTTHHAPSFPVLPATGMIHDPPSAPGSGYYPSNRETLLKNLHGLAVANSARGTNARTVMYDPAAAKNHPGGLAPSPTIQYPKADPLSFVEHSPSKEPDVVSPSEDENHPLRGFSEPLQWKDRPVEVFKEDGPTRTDDELRAVGRAMVQRIAAAYGHRSQTPTERRRAADDAVNEWFRDSHQQQVHATLRAYLDRIARQESRSLSDSSPHQTPIGEAPVDRPASSKAQSDINNHLIVPLLATIHGYLSESPQNPHRGAFGSFAGVPEWCVDVSRSGMTSFFGEDWGAPPARVGRDPRYRPVVVSSPRLGGFEDSAGVSLGGLGGEWGDWPRRFGR